MNSFCIHEISKKIGAHGANKYGIQKLGDLLTTSVQDISMRGGWALKSFNTFFDYWVGSFASSVRTGKCMSGWTTMNGQTYHGGYPPDLNDITHEMNRVEDFCSGTYGSSRECQYGHAKVLCR